MEIMNKKINETFEIRTVKKFHDHSELIDIVWPNFVEVEECILINKDSDSIFQIDLEHIYKQYGDKSGFEASVSHVHMIDISRTFKKHPLEGLKFAKKIMDMWARKLKIDFPNYKFVVILTFHDDDTIVRFHRLREEESAWVDIDNIEGYHEGVIVKIV